MARTHTPWGVWEPMTPTEVSQLFAQLGASWWLAGGYAIDLAVGQRLREHSDIDVLVLRRDQLAVQHAMAGWEWWAADPPGVLRPWQPQEILPQGVHDVWCRPAHDHPWQVQVMLDESSGPDWVSRRNARLRRPIAMLGHKGRDGIPYLAPEIQLFYKARMPRAKDEHDFTNALPVLTARQQEWLRAALADTYGDHPWQSRLILRQPQTLPVPESRELGNTGTVTEGPPTRSSSQNPVELPRTLGKS